MWMPEQPAEWVNTQRARVAGQARDCAQPQVSKAGPARQFSAGGAGQLRDFRFAASLSCEGCPWRSGSWALRS